MTDIYALFSQRQAITRDGKILASAMNELLKGSAFHVDKKWYYEWKELYQSQTTTLSFSSHKTDLPATRIQLGKYHFVFGCIDNDQEQFTWIQAERFNPTKFPMNHMLNFCFFVCKKINTGPHGFSVYTDSNYLRLL